MQAPVVGSQPTLRRDGFFVPAAVRRLLDDHYAGRRDNRKALWSLITFQLWMRHYGPDAPPA